MQQSKCLTDRQTNWFDRIRKSMTVKRNMKKKEEWIQYMDSVYECLTKAIYVVKYTAASISNNKI